MKAPRVLPLLAILGLGSAAHADVADPSPSTLTQQAAQRPAVYAEDSLTCQPQETMGDYQVLSCELPKRTTAQHFRFRAMFSGGHDDTVASLVATRLGGKPLACTPGSKTRLEGEDGDVSLECHFDVAARDAATTFEVQVRWSHAQYEGHALTRQ